MNILNYLLPLTLISCTIPVESLKEDNESTKLVTWSIDPCLQKFTLAIDTAMSDWNTYLTKFQFAFDSNSDNIMTCSTILDLNGANGTVYGNYNNLLVIKYAMDDNLVNFVPKVIVLHELGHVAAHKNSHIENGPAVMTSIISSWELTDKDIEYCGDNCK